jgi:hypothetical protein
MADARARRRPASAPPAAACSSWVLRGRALRREVERVRAVLWWAARHATPPEAPAAPVPAPAAGGAPAALGGPPFRTGGNAIARELHRERLLLEAYDFALRDKLAAARQLLARPPHAPARPSPGGASDLSSLESSAHLSTPSSLRSLSLLSPIPASPGRPPARPAAPAAAATPTVASQSLASLAELSSVDERRVSRAAAE